MNRTANIRLTQEDGITVVMKTPVVHYPNDPNRAPIMPQLIPIPDAGLTEEENIILLIVSGYDALLTTLLSSTLVTAVEVPLPSIGEKLNALRDHQDTIVDIFQQSSELSQPAERFEAVVANMTKFFEGYPGYDQADPGPACQYLADTLRGYEHECFRKIIFC